MLRDTLVRTRELLSDPSHWTKDAYARDEHGDTLLHTSRRAVCWCLSGAVRIQPTYSGTEMHFLRRIVAEKHPGFGNVPAFNDSPSTTHAMVLELLDYAIERASA